MKQERKMNSIVGCFLFLVVIKAPKLVELLAYFDISEICCVFVCISEICCGFVCMFEIWHACSCYQPFHLCRGSVSGGHLLIPTFAACREAEIMKKS